MAAIPAILFLSFFRKNPRVTTHSTRASTRYRTLEERLSFYLVKESGLCIKGQKHPLFWNG